ncbi:unnamed protein product [Closterium sp. Naga37s-1]|nr:unnamed protein product [Closterium sp. Naga37s-1]
MRRTSRIRIWSQTNRCRVNEVEASLAEFEAALELDPAQIPYLWQRGLSLFYLNRFAEASQQFRACIAANSRDAEESIWCFVSEARANGVDSARESMPEVPRDPGKVLRTAYEMFKTGADPLLVLTAAGDDEGGSSAFYARLYVGLFFEIMGDEATSRKYIQYAAETEYACRSSDYMAAVARVHCLRRQWPLPPSHCSSSFHLSFHLSSSFLTHPILLRSSDYMAAVARVHCLRRQWPLPPSTFDE